MQFFVPNYDTVNLEGKTELWCILFQWNIVLFTLFWNLLENVRRQGHLKITRDNGQSVSAVPMFIHKKVMSYRNT
jgi:hypothetical protein